MGFPKKHEQSVRRSVRVPKVIQDFLKEYFKNRDDFTDNDFINLLIENADEYKKFIALKAAEDKQQKLFA
ncbi:hypothetical protein [Campylobacter concisus]|uniref:hypothetical protein n=1 Tax=Campylobacter concisus TaxID=199 RepID=UPI000CD9A345|nr:hypothetical protein [Campylobacter concisus]